MCIPYAQGGSRKARLDLVRTIMLLIESKKQISITPGEKGDDSVSVLVLSSLQDLLELAQRYGELLCLWWTRAITRKVNGTAFGLGNHDVQAGRLHFCPQRVTRPWRQHQLRQGQVQGLDSWSMGQE